MHVQNKRVLLNLHYSLPDAWKISINNVVPIQNLLSSCKTANRLTIMLKLETVQCYQASKTLNHAVLLSIRTVALHCRGKLWSIWLNATKLRTNNKKCNFEISLKHTGNKRACETWKTVIFARVSLSSMKDVKIKEDHSCCIFKDTDDFLFPSKVMLFKITSKNIT